MDQVSTYVFSILTFIPVMLKNLSNLLAAETHALAGANQTYISSVVKLLTHMKDVYEVCLLPHVNPCRARR